MNAQGVSGNLFPLPTGDEEIVSVFPTGWHDNIRTLTMTGSQIKELAAAGYDAYGNGNPFPYVLVTKGGMELDDDTTYTIPVCGATEEVAEAAGGFTDSGVFGLDAAREYLSQMREVTTQLFSGLEDVMNNQWRTASEQCRTLQREKPQTMDGLMDFLQDQAVLGERISSFFPGACQLREQFPHF